VDESKAAEALEASGSEFPSASINHLSQSISIVDRLKAYLRLTKPTIMLLVLITGGTALILEGSFLKQPVSFLLFLAGLYMTGGAANAFNQYFEREIDSKMKRTMKRRP